KPEYEHLIEIAAGVTQHPDYPKVAWASALTADMIFTQPVVYEFPLVKVPTLLIIGQRDRTAVGRAWATKDVAVKLGDYPALGRKTMGAIPGAKLVEISGAGHLPQVEAFDAYSRALAEFLP
ncbi:MAG TPA: alpha/beta hydrolase, partial [Polyangiaceae bacterium]|nr:alpha/beta hydrolase [Polyangiaceae bacterium]